MPIGAWLRKPADTSARVERLGFEPRCGSLLKGRLAARSTRRIGHKAWRGTRKLFLGEIVHRG